MNGDGFASRGLDEDAFAPSSGISVSAFDAFPKTKKTYITKTQNGGIWTIAVVAFCIWLTVTEFWRWWAGTTTYTFSVEKGVAHDLQLNLDVVIAMSCDNLHVNVQDASGDRILAGEMLYKEPTRWETWSKGMQVDRKTGEKSRRGGGFDNWQTEQRQQYTKQEDVHDYLSAAKARRKWPVTPRLKRGEVYDSCRIFGSVEGNKVQGDFHITARGHGYQEFGAEHLDHTAFNFSHHINELSFGPYFPSIAQPLDDTHTITSAHFFKYQYYLSIVPTIYTDKPEKLTTTTPPQIALRNAAEMARRKQVLAVQADQMREAQLRGMSGDLAHARDQNVMAPSEPDSPTHRTGGGGVFNPFTFAPHTIYTNQYAVTEQSREVEEQAVPGLFFKYDIEPVLLTVSEEWGGMLGLIVRCVNVIAGVLVAGGWLVSLSEWAGEVAGRRRRALSVRGLLHGGKGEKEGMD